MLKNSILINANLKILLLSDATMCANAGGLSQTLYNIFSFLEGKDILCITSKTAFKEIPPSAPFTESYITYKFDVIAVPRNRLAKYIKPYAEWFNYFVSDNIKSHSGIKRRIKEFNPDVVVSCSNSPLGLFMHHKLLEGSPIKKVFPYFMDDWMFQKRYRWLDKKIYHWARKLLSDNPSWLMISMELANILENRYHVKSKSILEIHNPVSLSNAPEFIPLVAKDVYTVIYAGSLWPMHYDAFLVMARGFNLLRNKMKLKFIVHTTMEFWNWRKQDLEPLGVVYGGNIPYFEIHKVLANADILIVTSSFLEEWYSHSKGSIQTKLTDYLKARRLIVSCGPEYSANHKFLKKNQCGLCIETDNSEDVAEHLYGILNNIESYNEEVKNGWKLLEEEFAVDKVQKKLQHFFLK